MYIIKNGNIVRPNGEEMTIDSLPKKRKVKKSKKKNDKQLIYTRCVQGLSCVIALLIVYMLVYGLMKRRRAM